MFLNKVSSLFVKLSIEKIPSSSFVNLKICEEIRSFRGFKTMPVKYVTEYVNTIIKYPLLPSKQQHITKLSKNVRNSQIMTPDMMFSQEKRDEFLTYFPDILKQLEEKAATLDDVNYGKRYGEIMNHLSIVGNKYVGVVAVETYKMLTPKDKHTPENIRLANYLGWCLELLFDVFIIHDDIMDEEIMRRNKPCWHTLEHVKLEAINDACLLDKGIFYLLKNNFRHLDCYMNLVEHIQEGALGLYMGQHIDMKCKPDAFDTSLQLYRTIVRNESVYVASYLPVITGMTLAGYTDTDNIMRARNILQQLGHFYLIENDYMECINDPLRAGKPGTDIQTGKCRWPIVAFLEVATPEQVKLMKAHYGQNNEESVAVVKQLLNDVNIHQIFDNFLTELYNNLMKDIEENSYGDMKNVYLKLLETITFSTDAGGVYP